MMTNSPTMPAANVSVSVGAALKPLRTVVTLGVWSHHTPISCDDEPKIRELIDRVLKVSTDTFNSLLAEDSVRKLHQILGEPEDGLLRVVAHAAPGFSSLVAHAAVARSLPLQLIHHAQEGTQADEVLREGPQNKAERVLTIPVVEDDPKEQAKEANGIICGHCDILIVLHYRGNAKAFRRKLSTITDSGLTVLLLDTDTNSQHPIVLLKGSKFFVRWERKLRDEMKRVMLPATNPADISRLLSLVPQSKSEQANIFSWDKMFERILLTIRPERKQKDVKQATAGAAKECGKSAWWEYKGLFSDIANSYSTPYRNHLLLRYVLPLLSLLALIFAMYYKTLGVEDALVALIGHAAVLHWVLPPIFYGAQVAMLLLMFGIVQYSKRRHEHEIFYLYRILAESARVYTYAWPTGVFLNTGVTNGTSMTFSTWLTHRISRSLGLPSMTYDQQAIYDWLVWVKVDLVREQMRYHLRRRKKYSSFAAILTRYSFYCFVIGICFSITRAVMNCLNSLGATDSSMAVFIAFIGICALSFPSLAGFFGGFSKNAGYEEYKTASSEAFNNFREMEKRINHLLERRNTANQYISQQVSYAELAEVSQFIARCTLAELGSWERSIKGKALRAQ